MPECTCPQSWRQIPSDKRVTLMEPGAVIRQGPQVVKDHSKIHVFHAECPAHGYRDITEEKETRHDAK